MADLVRHMAVVHEWWRAIALGEVADPAEFVPADQPGEADLVGWYRAGLEALVEAVGDLDPATPCWTWSSRHEVGWVQRRLAQETAVHAWDAVAATGAAEPIEAELAIDGVDEYLDEFLTRRAHVGDGPPMSAHLHSTDAPGEWVVRLGGGGLEVERTHAKGDLAVRAPASDLLLLLWGRTDGGDGFEVFGGEDLLVRFLSSVRPT